MDRHDHTAEPSEGRSPGVPKLSKAERVGQRFATYLDKRLPQQKIDRMANSFQHAQTAADRQEIDFKRSRRGTRGIIFLLVTAVVLSVFKFLQMPASIAAAVVIVANALLMTAPVEWIMALRLRAGLTP